MVWQTSRPLLNRGSIEMKKEIERLSQRNDLLTKVVGEYKSSDRKEKKKKRKKDEITF
jgi:hypothetical protein